MSEIFLKIHGEVHGVGFRYASQKFADSLSLTGYARNAADGTVEILAQGEKEILEQLISWVKTSAPGSIEKLETEWREPNQIYSAFEIAD